MSFVGHSQKVVKGHTLKELVGTGQLPTSELERKGDIYSQQNTVVCYYHAEEV